MCGIGGALGRPGDGSIARFGATCLDANARRGPDHRAERALRVGEWEVSLAHNRLAILDLTPGGHQPMEGSDGDLVITYNGEIYNHGELRETLRAQGHVFRSTSDTEVLLAAYRQWGTAAFERCNGMFALALLDRPRRELLLVRDRFGVKPLHYHLSATRVLFASTATPIATVVGREPDREYLARSAHYAVFEDDSDRTQYRNVRAVRPGHLMRIRLDGPSLSSSESMFYSLEDRVRTLSAAPAPPRDGAIAECRQRLTDAVRLRLMADVPVAVSLSGGIDSATLCALASTIHPGLIGFTYGRPDRAETEGPVAAQIAESLGLRIHWVWPDARDLAELFWDCLDAQDAPFTTGSIVAQYAVYREVRRAGVKVLLGGQGGDEAFMGYRKYLVWRWTEVLRQRRLGESVRAMTDVSRALWAQRSQWRTYLSAARRYAGRGSGGRLLGAAAAPSPYHEVPGLGLAGRQIQDITAGGLPTMLRYEDRNSMGNSVESRLPYLDYRLMEWAVALPVDLKLREGFGKWILRQVAPARLPTELVQSRAKRGFDVSVADWMAQGLGRRIRDELARTWRRSAEFFRPGVDPERDFADRFLATDGGRFADAVAALWIGRCLS